MHILLLFYLFEWSKLKCLIFFACCSEGSHDGSADGKKGTCKRSIVPMPTQTCWPDFLQKMAFNALGASVLLNVFPIMSLWKGRGRLVEYSLET